MSFVKEHPCSEEAMTHEKEQKGNKSLPTPTSIENSFSVELIKTYRQQLQHWGIRSIFTG